MSHLREHRAFALDEDELNSSDQYRQLKSCRGFLSPRTMALESGALAGEESVLDVDTDAIKGNGNFVEYDSVAPVAPELDSAAAKNSRKLDGIEGAILLERGSDSSLKVPTQSDASGTGGHVRLENAVYDAKSSSKCRPLSTVEMLIHESHMGSNITRQCPSKIEGLLIGPENCGSEFHTHIWLDTNSDSGEKFRSLLKQSLVYQASDQATSPDNSVDDKSETFPLFWTNSSPMALDFLADGHDNLPRPAQLEMVPVPDLC